MNDTMTPCNDCGTLVPTEIHAEELGFCLDCSNQYWGHYGKYDSVWGLMGRPDNPLEACECGQDDPLPIAHEDGCPIWEAAKNEQMEREMK